MTHSPKIAVIGLGYVGLPLALALARTYHTIGFDVDEGRVEELRRGADRTGEATAEALAGTALAYVHDIEGTRDADVYIVTVPTPVDDANVPDLSALNAACAAIGPVLAAGDVVVFESTVYPGVTEDVCGPALEKASGLACGRDFFLGYSPERINPGDREHTVDRITKVVAGQTPDVAEKLGQIYGAVTSGGVFLAKSIRTAEAAKVIENAQRDINIAFINEVSMIFTRLGLSTEDVLEAARTKWNFLDFRPGLVGGHCIGVDPYYLAHCAQQLDHHPHVILSGRRINDGMGGFVAGEVDTRLRAAGHAANGRILVLGLTFKENVPDLRNTKVIDVVRGLAAKGWAVDVHDVQADPDEARTFYGVELIDALPDDGRYAAVVGAVPHKEYLALDGARLAAMMVPGGLLADIKGMWRSLALVDGVGRWEL